MNKFLQNILTGACIATLSMTAIAQERYLDKVFDEVNVTEGVVYGNNISILPVLFEMDPAPEDLLMDVYEPAGDTLSQRPLVILAHRGDFLPPIVNQSPYGSRKDSAVVEMCMDYARRGFVAASVDYRLGWNPLSPQDKVIKETVLQAVYRITQDLRTAVRFFRREAAENGNSFSVDTSRIAVGGMDAAGYAAVNVGCLTNYEQSLQPKFLDFSTQPPTPFLIEEVHGDPYGLNEAFLNIPNHVGYSSDVSAVITFEGGLGEFEWLTAESPPVIVLMPEDKFSNAGIRDVTIGVGGSIIIAEGAFPDTIAHRANELGINDPFIEANFEDPLTQIALERSGGLEGIYLYRPFTLDTSIQCDNSAGAPSVSWGGNAYPWNWYDEATFAFTWDFAGLNPPSAQKICEYNTGEGNPNDPAISRAMIDTLQRYIVPRLMAAFAEQTSTQAPQLSKEAVGLTIFPNPTRDVVSFRANEEIMTLELYDMAGKLLMSRHRALGQQTTLDLRPFGPGFYVSRLSFDQGVVSQKIVVGN